MKFKTKQKSFIIIDAKKGIMMFTFLNVLSNQEIAWIKGL